MCNRINAIPENGAIVIPMIMNNIYYETNTYIAKKIDCPLLITTYIEKKNRPSVSLIRTRKFSYLPLTK